VRLLPQPEPASRRLQTGVAARQRLPLGVPRIVDRQEVAAAEEEDLRVGSLSGAIGGLLERHDDRPVDHGRLVAEEHPHRRPTPRVPPVDRGAPNRNQPPAGPPRSPTVVGDTEPVALVELHVGALHLGESLVGTRRILRPDVPSVEEEDPLPAITGAVQQLVAVVRLARHVLDGLQCGPRPSEVGAARGVETQTRAALPVLGVVKDHRVLGPIRSADHHDVLAVVVAVPVGHHPTRLHVARIGRRAVRRHGSGGHGLDGRWNPLRRSPRP